MGCFVLALALSCFFVNFQGLYGILTTQLTVNLQLGHPTQETVNHVIILLKYFIQLTRRYIRLKN